MSVKWYKREADGSYTDFSSYVALYLPEVTTNAEEGSTAQSSINIDDPAGTFNLTPLGWRVKMTETLATGSNTVTYIGYPSGRSFERGTNRVGVGRFIEMSMDDPNSVLSRRVLTSSSANRPAETDVARILWLCNDADGQLIIDDTRFVQTSGAVAMDAVDYRGQSMFDVINDCAQQSGKNFAAIFLEDAADSGIGLWYDFVDSTRYTSSLRLSNGLADIDNVLTFAISEDTKLERDPSRVYSGVYLQYDGGSVYVRNQTTGNTFNIWRDAVLSTFNVKTRAQATIRANRYLASVATEDDVITTSVVLPADKVNWLRECMRVQFRATHFPDYNNFTWLRVLSRTIKQNSEEPTQAYLVTYKLSTEAIPASPTAQGSTNLSANLSIGSASHLGIGADRYNQSSSQVGAGSVTLVPGRQYRIVATITDDFNSPLGGYDSMADCGCFITLPASTTKIKQPTYTWTPADGTGTASLNYEGLSFNFKSSGPSGQYATGVTINGDWLTFNGPSVSADLTIEGHPLSGFYGFHWFVTLELQVR